MLCGYRLNPVTPPLVSKELQIMKDRIDERTTVNSDLDKIEFKKELMELLISSVEKRT